MKWKKGKNQKIIWRLFLCTLSAIVILFVVRASSREMKTDFSASEIIRLAKIYTPGRYYDCNQKEIVEEDEFEDIIGIDIEQTMNSKATIAGSTPWTFGLEDNNFGMDNLLSPWKERVGGSTILTYDKDVQAYVKQLAEKSGYEDVQVVVSNWKTGTIYATLGDVYTRTFHSGSTIKPILAAAALTIDPGLQKYTYDCCEENHTFQTKEGTYRIACAGGKYHGKVDMEKAIIKSCNGYFISLVQQVPKEQLVKVMKQWGFDSVLSFEQFMFWDHTFLGKSEKESDYLMAAIGQGNVKITPFGLNLCTNALVSGTGSIREPVRVLAKSAGPEEEWKYIKINNTYEFCDGSVAETVRNMMQKSASRETGRKYAMDGFAAKTGTAQKEGNLNTVWTTGGLVSEDTPYSVTVCLDNVSKEVSSSAAGEMAKEILTYMIGGEEE